jgi:hypothetical protein
MPTPQQKQIANRVLATLENTADLLDGLAAAGKIDPRLASHLAHDIDAFSDKFEVAVYGKENLQRRASRLIQAKVVQRDSDEKYMETFENTVKPITTDADEKYMHTAEHGYNSTKNIGTYDVDRSSTMFDRDEYNVRDLNEFSPGTKKQPSWEKGPAGKSTAIGSAPRQQQPRQAARPQQDARPAPAKNWAP